MKDYKASIMIDNKLEKVEFETEDNPVEFLWTRYGMDTFIEYIIEKKEEKDIEE